MAVKLAACAIVRTANRDGRLPHHRLRFRRKCLGTSACGERLQRAHSRERTPLRRRRFSEEQLESEAVAVAARDWVPRTVQDDLSSPRHRALRRRRWWWLARL